MREMLEVIELEGQQKKMPVNLSGGMKKRVGLARAIIRRPSCILYDEPTAGLDPVVSDSINRLIRRLQERYHVTSIVVTHDMKSAFHIADHIAYLHEGRIYFYGTPEEIQASTDPLIQDFLVGPGRALRRRNEWNEQDRGLELKVGMFVFVGLAVLAALVVQFGRLGEGFKSYYDLTVHFPMRAGCSKGSDVLMGGAKIGRVSGRPRLSHERSRRGCAAADLRLRENSGRQPIHGRQFGFVRRSLRPGLVRLQASRKAYIAKARGSRARARQGSDDLTREGGELVKDLRGTVAKIDTAVTPVERAGAFAGEHG